MRRIPIAAVLAVCVAAIAVAGALAATATITVAGQVGGKATPKFDKKTYKPTTIDFTTTNADSADPTALPPKVNRTVTVFDAKDIKFNPDAVPGCDPSQIANATTEDALAVCGDAKVGGGEAVVNLPFGTGGTRQDVDAVITAFNRSDTKGILLHSRVTALQTTTVLEGVLNGATLTVTVPPIAGGAGSSSLFHTTVGAKDYVQARCKDKTIDYKETYSFADAPDAQASDSQACKQKKPKH
jgi:hypothetical protein